MYIMGISDYHADQKQRITQQGLETKSNTEKVIPSIKNHQQYSMDNDMRQK